MTKWVIQYDEKVDIWSLGSLMYQVLTGKVYYIVLISLVPQFKLRSWIQSWSVEPIKERIMFGTPPLLPVLGRGGGNV